MKPPPGYTAVWSAIGICAGVVIVYNALHHPAAPQIQAGPRTTVTVTATARGSEAVTVGPRVGLPAAGGAKAPAAAITAATSTDRRTSPAPRPAAPSQSPKPDRSAGVSAAIVVPLRGATPVAVRASVVAPSAPPFPQPSPAIGVTVQLPGLTVTALP